MKTKLRAGFFARRDFLLASNRKKKHHIAQPPKMPILLISPPKIMLLKIPSYRNTHHDPARDTVERRGAVVGVHLVGWVPSSE
jgi:hypothetical protein